MSIEEPEVGQLCVAKFPTDDRLVMNDSVLATSLEGKFCQRLTYIHVCPYQAFNYRTCQYLKIHLMLGRRKQFTVCTCIQRKLAVANTDHVKKLKEALRISSTTVSPVDTRYQI